MTDADEREQAPDTNTLRGLVAAALKRCDDATRLPVDYVTFWLLKAAEERDALRVQLATAQQQLGAVLFAVMRGAAGACEHCEERPATCVTPCDDGEPALACDECCHHDSGCTVFVRAALTAPAKETSRDE